MSGGAVPGQFQRRPHGKPARTTQDPPAPSLIGNQIPHPSTVLYWRPDGYEFLDEACTIFAHLRMIPVDGEAPPWNG